MGSSWYLPHWAARFVHVRPLEQRLAPSKPLLWAPPSPPPPPPPPCRTLWQAALPIHPLCLLRPGALPLPPHRGRIGLLPVHPASLLPRTVSHRLAIPTLCTLCLSLCSFPCQEYPLCRSLSITFTSHLLREALPRCSLWGPWVVYRLGTQDDLVFSLCDLGQVAPPL